MPSRGDGDTVFACPYCDSSRLCFKSSKGWKGDGKKHVCRDCGETFDDPAERERYIDGSQIPTHGAARKLAIIGEQRDWAEKNS